MTPTARICLYWNLSVKEMNARDPLSRPQNIFVYNKAVLAMYSFKATKRR